jgi:hypothetical protein
MARAPRPSSRPLDKLAPLRNHPLFREFPSSVVEHPGTYMTRRSERRGAFAPVRVTLPVIYGRPAEPADLARHACLILSRNPGSASWPFRIDGKLTRIDVKGCVSADSADMVLQLAIAGAGILRLSEHVVALHPCGTAATPAAGRAGSGNLPIVCSAAAGPSSGCQGEGLRRFSDRAPRLRAVANRRRTRRVDGEARRRRAPRFPLTGEGRALMADLYPRARVHLAF